MNPERWRQIEEVFHDALELGPAARAGFLAEACGGDAEMLREVESLLTSYEKGDSFMAAPAVEYAAPMLTGDEADSLVGRRLSHYEIVSRLGAGGMGEVYLAEDAKLHRRVALKLLPAEFCRDSERALRLLREAQVASALNHPNICTIYEINDECDTPFIAMEYVEGETLDAKIKSRKLDLRGVLDISLQVSEALAEAHAHGIVHRDIKPSNIILNRRGQVKILDFGLAKKIAAGSEAETQQLLSQAGVLLGTVAYMSPEQARGLPVDARTDVWSFGVVLYEMLAGDRPFNGETTTDVLAAILRGEPEGLRKVKREVPGELERIVLKALRKDRDERYESAKGLHNDLRRLKEELEFPAARKGITSADTQADAETKVFKAEVTAVTEAHRSVAVLPFANMSSDAENEYFCEGLAEELINALTKIEDLRVAARTSAFSFKGKGADVREVGRRLGVSAVLEGSVRKAGNRLRVTAQLVSVADGYHLWSERYDRQMEDVFDVQDEISLAIVAALKVRLLGAEKAALLKRHTDDPEAYQLYLRGRYCWNKRTPEGIAKGIKYFQQAIELDPDYAVVYAGLADCYLHRGGGSIGLPPHEAMPKGKATAMRALELDNTLAEAHASLATAQANYDWNWSDAEKGYRRAIELNPNYTEAHHSYSHFLTAMSRPEASLAESLRALELEPVDLPMNVHLGWHYIQARQYDEAMAHLRKTLEMDSNFLLTHLYLGLAYEQKGMLEEAVAALRRAAALSELSTEAAAALGHAYGLAGRASEAREVLNGLKEQAQRGYVSAYFIATVHLGLGEIDETFEWLAKACEDREQWLIYLNVEPKLERLRSDPRFQDLLRRVGLHSGAAQQMDETASSERAEGEQAEGPAARAADTGATRHRWATGRLTGALKESKRGLALTLAVLLAAAVGTAYLYSSRSGDAPAASVGKPAIDSMAVLPFVNVSGDPNIEYLSEGITESLTNSLSQVPRLRMIASSSASRYKGQESDPLRAGHELGVQAVLTGRVTQRGDDLSINVELADVRDNTHVWGNQYNRKLSDLLVVQEEISREISEKLRLKLTGGEQKQLTKNYTGDPEAYQLYLKGRYYWNKRTDEGVRKAADYFRQAIAKDPNYALAFSGLADCYNSWKFSFDLGSMPPSEAVPKAKEAAAKALELDDTLAEAHTSMAYTNVLYDWDWPGAEREFKRALELDPNYVNAHHWYSHYLMAVGRTEESLAESKRSLELDPLDLVINTHLGWHYIFAHQYDPAVEQLRKTLEMDPNYGLAHWYLGLAYEQKQMYAEAAPAFRKATELLNGNLVVEADLGHCYAVSGKRDEARKTIEKLQKLSKQRYVSSYGIALIYAGLGDKERAFVWLEKAYQERSDMLVYLNVDPRLDGLHADPRFTDLLRRMKLPA